MKKILVVDDEVALRSLILVTLEVTDCELLEARDGFEALKLVSREQPDLVLLDWMMPGLNGISVVEELRSNDRTANIPIIMLTAKGLERDIQTGSQLGLQAFMVKPFSPKELLDRVEGLLS